MRNENALVPVDQKVVLFYEDEIMAVSMEDGTIFVPVRPLVEYLGLSWGGQYERINRDVVLSEVAASVRITRTEGERQFTRDLLCLPLDYLNGWLFGVSAARVNPEVRERLIRYQKECYRVLARAFVKEQGTTDVSPTTATLLQVREMGRAIMQMAEEQIEFERRLVTTEGRLDHAAVIVGDLTRRVTSLEQKVAPGQPVTEDQASQIGQAVKAVAIALGKKSGRNEFGGVYGELYRKFGVTSYKMLPARRFDEAMKFLTDWHGALSNDEAGLPF